MTCLTPGATYSLSIRGKTITHEVTVPPGVAMPRDLRPLKAALHDAMEKALADLFYTHRMRMGQ